MKLVITATYFLILTTITFLHAVDTHPETLNSLTGSNIYTDHLPPALLTKRKPNQSPAHLYAQAAEPEEEATQSDRAPEKRFFNTHQATNTYIREIQRIQNETEKCYTRMGWSVSTIPQYSLTLMPSIPWWMLLAGDDRRKKRFYSYRTRYDLTQLKAIHSECKGRWMKCTQEVEKTLNLILPPIRKQADLLRRCADLNGHPVIQPDYWEKVMDYPVQKLFYLLKIYLADVKACFARIGRLPNGDLITTTSTTTTTTTPKPTTTTTTTTTTTPKPTTTTTTTTTTTPKPTTTTSTTTTTTTTTTPLPTTTPGVFTTTTTPIPTTTLC